jgi:hypothetical protein
MIFYKWKKYHFLLLYSIESDISYIVINYIPLYYSTSYGRPGNESEVIPLKFAAGRIVPSFNSP